MTTKKERTTMISALQLLAELKEQKKGEQKKFNTNSPLAAYFGYNNNGQLRLSFLSTTKPPKLEPTKYINIVQGPDATGTFWLCFDVLLPDQENVFGAFCENIVNSISYAVTEEQAYLAIRRQYAKWKALFRSSSSVIFSKEYIQGLFGELLFLSRFMIGKYGIERAIKSWSGVDGTSKDFSIETSWYELKTIGTKSPIVQISSISQLDSDSEGRLVINKVETMSDEYDCADCCIKSLFNSISNQINDEELETIFAEKIASTNIFTNDKAVNMKFAVQSMTFYKVDSDFPRLTRRNVGFSEINDVQYSLSVESLKKYEVNPND